MKEKNPDVEAHIFRSVENVNLDTVIAYKQGGKKHHFLDLSLIHIFPKENPARTRFRVSAQDLFRKC